MKQASEIYETMRSVFQEKTGLSPAGDADISVRLYAAAAELETLYAYCDWALNQSFPQLATGEYLDLHASLRGLFRKPAAAAEGILRFCLEQARQTDVTVEAGTVCTDAGLRRFVTVEEGVIPAGSLFCDVKACAEETGSSGNAASGTVTGMTLAPVGVSSCYNPEAFSGGTDEENDAALRQRVLDSFCRLPNGANAAFYETRAAANDGVAGVQVLPRVRGTGTVDVVISAAGGAPSEELLDAVQADLQSVREISVDVLVRAPEEKSVDVAVTVWPDDAYTAEEAAAAAKAAVEGFFSGELLGKPVYLAQLGSRIYATGKVKNYAVTAPAADVAAGDGVLPVLGSLKVTEGD